jgi:uncharacterized protein (TIGR02001 family)
MLGRVRTAVAALGVSGVLVAAGVAMAADEPKPTWLPENFTASVAVQSDYAFRGISQTFEDPAYQLTAEWTPAGGPIYIGAFVSNVDFRDTVNARKLAAVELDLLFGVRGELGFLKWDVGAIGYIYPGMHKNAPPPGVNTNFHYMEGALKTSWDVLGWFSVVGNVFVSPNFQTGASTGVYMEAGVDYTAPWDIAISARFGRQNIENNNNFGTPDYWTWSLGISKEFFGRVVLGAAYTDTDISRGRCFGGTTLCEARGIGYVTFKF